MLVFVKANGKNMCDLPVGNNFEKKYDFMYKSYTKREFRCVICIHNVNMDKEKKNNKIETSNRNRSKVVYKIYTN